MKTLKKDELFQNLQGFLKTKGVDLTEGSYSKTIQKGCSLLSDAINTSQEGLGRAKAGIDKKLDQLRQIVHEKTAPRTQGTSTPPNEPEASTKPPPSSSEAKTKSTRRPKRKPKK